VRDARGAWHYTGAKRESLLPIALNIQLLSQGFDYSATLLWAISGAMIGARKGYAILGVFVLALVSSTGGGLLRDGLLLQDGPPRLLRSPAYLEIVLVATGLILFFGGRIRRLKWFDRAISAVDALGAGLYAVVGMNLALAAGLPTIAVVVVGMVNAVGGGVLRDLLIGAEPDLFKPGKPYALTALAGCILFVTLIKLAHASEEVADLATVGLTALLRVAAGALKLESTPLKAFEEDWLPPRHGSDE
jgi:uncharacterized membrane protein YeiH